MSSSTGGSSSTATTRLPALSLSNRGLSPAVRWGRWLLLGLSCRAGRGLDRAAASRAMCWGVVPQQPPTMAAPLWTISTIFSAK